MSQNQTERYGLHLWEPSDDFLRVEFNENFKALDGALGDKSEVVFGSYYGDDTENRVIQLGFTPKCVIMPNTQWGFPYYGDVDGGVFFPETDIPNFKIVPGGFQVSNQESHGGSTNNRFQHFYLAFR